LQTFLVIDFLNHPSQTTQISHGLKADFHS